jgi:hypothetical protein
MHEYGLVEKNLVIYGDLRFRAHVVKAMHESVHNQIKQRVRTQVSQIEFESARTIKLSHEMTEKIMDSLRGPAFDDNARYVVGREDLQTMVVSYDEARREQIITAVREQ